MLFLYTESGDTPHTVVPYDISSDVRETRIVIDELGGRSRAQGMKPGFFSPEPASLQPSLA